MSRRVTFLVGPLVLALLGASGPNVGAANITVDGSQTYQTIDGFGVNANYYSWGEDLQPVLDGLIDQAGMTLFRVIFNEGWETNNDNGDASVMNWDYYNAVYGGPDAQKLWSLIGALNQRGITNGIMPNFQGHGSAWMVDYSNTLPNGYEDEWAEAVASLLVYARNTRHLQFSVVAPNNEPDLGSEGIRIPTAARHLAAQRALVRKLDTNGLSDFRIVGPDRSNSGTNWLPEMLGDPLVMSKVGHFGLHSYSSGGGGSGGVYDLLQGSAYPDLTFWMTEFNVWCNVCENGPSGTNNWDYFRGTAEYLLAYLANGASGGLVWEGYDSYYPHHARWSFWGLFAVDNTNAFPRTYTPRKNFYTLSQITKFVQPGARRIDVSGSADPFSLVAFYHPDTGQLTITGANADPSPAVLSGTLSYLPPIASLELYYTDSTTNLFHSATVPVTNGTFDVTVPADCVFTLTGFDPAGISVSVVITNPLDGAGFSAPASIPIQAIANTTTGLLSSVHFFNGATPIGSADAPPYGITWSNVVPGAYVLTARATNSLGHVGVSPAVRAIVTGPPAQIAVTPANAMVVPYGTQQFTAVATDALGNTLAPPPLFTWSANAGGIITGSGLFAAGANEGGPFIVTARSGGVSGTASLLITTNANLAIAGTGFTWYGMTGSTNNLPQVLASGINDGDLLTDVPLLWTGEHDVANAYQAAGVVWPAPQTVNRVIYFNGSYDAWNNGVFAAQFGLQFSPDGQTWTNAGQAWVVTPSYTYNSRASADASFTFTGGVATVLGVRCVGRVHTSEASINSWQAVATELQTFAAPAIPVPVLTAKKLAGSVVISWPGALTNYALEAASNVWPPLTWSPVTNTPVLSGGQLSVTLAPASQRSFLRLHLQP
jgi:O-glycosyl hydrolase